MLAPVEAEPAHVGLDGVDVLLLLLERVRVVKAQVAAPAELARDAEVQADRLGVADVQVAVGLGREPRDDGVDAPIGQVGGDDVADEVAALGRGCVLVAHVGKDSTEGVHGQLSMLLAHPSLKVPRESAEVIDALNRPHNSLRIDSDIHVNEHVPQAHGTGQPLGEGLLQDAPASQRHHGGAIVFRRAESLGDDDVRQRCRPPPVRPLPAGARPPPSPSRRVPERVPQFIRDI